MAERRVPSVGGHRPVRSKGMSMDTEAIWQAIGAYGNARWRGRSHETDAADHLSDIKRLLKEAEDERAELLKENERLNDEVDMLKKALVISGARAAILGAA